MRDRELMQIHVDTLFTHDSRGRMLRVNEPEGKDAPRFFLGRTAEGIVWRVRHDVPIELAKEVEAACSDDRFLADPLELPGGSPKYNELLARFAPIQREWSGPAYHFPNDLPPAPGVVALAAENADVLRPHLEEWREEIASRLRQPAFVSLIDGRAVSICASVRIGEVAHEAGVETAPAFRGRGHAMRAVSAWARALRHMGKIPLYSTSWQNGPSRAVAGRLRLLLYGADMHVI